MSINWICGLLLCASAVAQTTLELSGSSSVSFDVEEGKAAILNQSYEVYHNPIQGGYCVLSEQQLVKHHFGCDGVSGSLRSRAYAIEQQDFPLWFVASDAIHAEFEFPFYRTGVPWAGTVESATSYYSAISGAHLLDLTSDLLVIPESSHGGSQVKLRRLKESGGRCVTRYIGYCTGEANVWKYHQRPKLPEVRLVGVVSIVDEQQLLEQVAIVSSRMYGSNISPWTPHVELLRDSTQGPDEAERWWYTCSYDSLAALRSVVVRLSVIQGRLDLEGAELAGGLQVIALPLPDYLDDERYAHLDLLELPELRLLRNEIFARHGYRFQSPELLAHFVLQPWYNEMLPAAEVGEEELSDRERDTLQRIREREALLAEEK